MSGRHFPIPIHPAPPPGSEADAPQNPARRALLGLMAASAALAGAGCSGPPQETIVPYVDMPEGQAQGDPVYYASAVVRDGYAHGVLVQTRDGRPTKVEGNPHHPTSRGTTDIHAQATILQLWDPDRSRAILDHGDIAGWQAFRQALEQRRPHWDDDQGASLRILTGTVTSPTLLRQLQALRARYPAMQWHRHDPMHDAAAAAGAQQAWGLPVTASLDLAGARVVAAYGADLFGAGPGAGRYASDFMAARRAMDARPRLYVLESTPTLTGAMADERRALPPAELEAALRRLAAALQVPGVDAGPTRPGTWDTALARSLQAHPGASLVVAGPALGAASHALAWAINATLGNIGRTVLALPAPGPAPLGDLLNDMRAGKVDTLVVMDANPVYDTPGALRFAQALARVPCTVHMGLYRDETARAATWHLPRTHDFEDWSDARACDGTASIVQPAIAPLHGGRSLHVLLDLLIDGTERTAYQAVRDTWRALLGSDDADARWRGSLRLGLIRDAGLAPVPAHRLRAWQSPGDDSAVSQATASAPAAPGGAHVVALFVPDGTTGAGAWANNAWLQELPRPLTQITWDNAALLSEGTAKALQVDTGDVVLFSDGRVSVQAPVYVLAGQADGVVTLPLGYGRHAAGRVGDGVGFDAYPLAPASVQAAAVAVLAVQRTGHRHAFARTQQETSTHGRDLVRLVALDRAATPDTAGKTAQPSLYPPVAYPDYAWAMTIDLDVCIGCKACTVACQAENNIPVVGKEEVARGRAMHWIRVDVYQDDAERTLFQPVPCMHCENAPCEEVCPVGATVHDSEGLNAQVYNRCVGTRFCSNNCPYKVRRFNFLQYADGSEESAAHQNPDVTVRRRGVMEKCTYCVQRISRARIEAEKQGRAIRDGEVVTACEAVCPTQAIVFGNLNDPHSRVSQSKRSPRDYVLLEELNTRPRTTYLARVQDSAARLEPDDG
jgi:molybdopterin-containing oxidoreductase family iron-sulfur binding subunit